QRRRPADAGPEGVRRHHPRLHLDHHRPGAELLVRRAAPFLVALVVAACGKAPTAPPRALPVDLAPTSVLGGSLGLYRNTAPGTVAAFHQGDKTTLVDEGGLWEVRRKDRLIGTLQIETLKDDVDLRKRSVRDHITDPLLVGARGDIRL